MPDFKIFSLSVGGGTLALSQMPGRNGDFAADLAILLAWAPSVVVTMVEASEIAAHGAEGLGSLLKGVQWQHFPVPDYQTPRPEQDHEWLLAQEKSLNALSQGQKVLVHCMGGCGRSGMSVLRLMIAAGEAPDLALARLRGVRPCAVETEAQMVWATTA